MKLFKITLSNNTHQHPLWVVSESKSNAIEILKKFGYTDKDLTNDYAVSDYADCFSIQDVTYDNKTVIKSFYYDVSAHQYSNNAMIPLFNLRGNNEISWHVNGQEIQESEVFKSYVQYSTWYEQVIQKYVGL